MTVHALILAGGEGTRFAPLSTKECPKQFLALVGDTSLIRQTADRIQHVVPKDRCWVATGARYVNLVCQHLPELDFNQPHSGVEGATRAHIIAETQKKNTAPAIALVAACVRRADPDAVMVVLPSDHVITDEKSFHAILKTAFHYAERNDVLVTLGITPTWTSSDYGYIERGIAECPGIFRIRRFVEKPDASTAETYLRAGTYSWNSGMFVWKADLILEEIRRYLPDIYSALQSLDWNGNLPTPDAIARFFAKVPSISIDYGIMEKSERVVVIPVEMGWSDVGTWSSLKRLVDSGAVKVRADIQNDITQYAGD